MPSKRKELWLRVEVMSCAHCGTHSVCLGNEHGGMRLSGHKCAGAWNRVSGFDVPVKAFKADVAECIAVYAFERKPARARPPSGEKP